MVLDHQDGDSENVADRADLLAEPAHLLVVQPAGRLVEQQQDGLGGQRAGQLDPLLDRERQPTDRSLGDRAELEPVDQLAGVLAGTGLALICACAARLLLSTGTASADTAEAKKIFTTRCMACHTFG
ncbi:MAG TPA: hypothetical protein VK601_16005, partial [Kofleriaceae bacterium]|nr:hypothetical protein [Kofleriaceae bacterium]